MAKEQLSGDGTAAKATADDEEQFRNRRADRFMVDSNEGLDVADALRLVLRDAGELDQHNLMVLGELEASYHRSLFDTALEKANYLVENAETPIAMYARSIRMLIMTATGNGEEAYRDLLVLKSMCKKGLAKRDDEQLFSASAICALSIESVLMTSLFEFPDIAEGSDGIPTGLKVYFGHLLAMRFLRLGRYQEAYGVAFSFLSIVTARIPSTRMYLHCVAASAQMLMGDVDRARVHFNKAWELKDEYGIIMPFIELNYALLGLPRINRAELATPDEIQRVDAMISSFSKGWYYLRRQCGLSTESELLTPLENYACSLAALGWRNKEIGRHLLVSESAVKHRLSSAYLKLNVSNRAELQRLFRTPPQQVRDYNMWL